MSESLKYDRHEVNDHVVQEYTAKYGEVGGLLRRIYVAKVSNERGFSAKRT
jgi:hypothetical protein